jgi:hypothetical protein
MTAVRRRPRGSGFISIGLCVALLAIVAAVSLTAQPPSPPPVAEFAPVAPQQIKDAPADQSSRFGSGDGGEGGGAAGPGGTTTTTAPPPAAPASDIKVPRVHRCVGDPPRQTEDSQSPPCIAYWEGDNGGATSKGVTADQITVVSYTGDDQVNADFAAYFNRRFEFYGRKLNIVAGPDAGANCLERRANAEDVDTRFQPFASLDPVASSNTCYYDEIARRKIIAVVGDPQLSEATMAANAPYKWQYPMAYDKEFAYLGRWACSRLAGKKAVHATDLTYRDQVRKFGAILQTDEPAYGYSMQPLKDELARCGAKLEAEYQMQTNRSGQQGNDASDPAQAQNAVLKMRNAGVTSVFCLCLFVAEANIAASASSQAYQPEWMFSSVFFNDGDFWYKSSWQGDNQRQSSFGLTFKPRQTPYADQPVTRAIKEVDPAFEFSNSFQFVNLQAKYQQLLLLASGIQMAGPHLTPQTFEAALHRTVFPNPDLPIHEGKVGFPNGSHAMTIDAAEFWYSPTQPSPFPELGAGTWCYENGGTRRDLADWKASSPETDPLFQPPCR